VDDPDIVVAEALRRPADAEKTREVQVKSEVAQVSVIDGYRVMYGSKASREFVANVKIERSDPAQYGNDKAPVLEGVEAMASGEGGSVHTAMVDGVSVAGVDTKDLKKPGTVGVHTMFSDRSSVIVTIYLLNQAREPRKFTNAEQHARTRDDFLKAFSRCMCASDGVAVAP
jgi:hypothetical protein